VFSRPAMSGAFRFACLAEQMKRRVIRICTDSEINGTEKPQRLSLAEQGNRNHPNDVSAYKFWRSGSLQQQQPILYLAAGDRARYHTAGLRTGSDANSG
jgi:hypothetical protein